MHLHFLRRTALAVLFCLASGWTVALAQVGNASVAEALKPLLMPAKDDVSGWDWQGLDADRNVRWGPGPIMLKSASPDGSFFARPGQMIASGRQMMIVATGARTIVGSFYIRDPGPLQTGEAIESEFKRAGYAVTPARCPINSSVQATRHWYRIVLPGYRPSFVYAGPLASGGQGYVLYLNDMPPMTQSEAASYTDDCANAGKPGARPSLGQLAVAQIVESLLPPTSAQPSLSWAQVRQVPLVQWMEKPPYKMASPYTEGGADNNQRLMEGNLQTGTTRMSVVATGDDRTANRFLLRQGTNLPFGSVFQALAHDGYAITPLRCGKAYIKSSENWFRISGPGKRPAILYRSIFNDDGYITTTYGVRLDNVLPPIQQGQTQAGPGGCRG